MYIYKRQLVEISMYTIDTDTMCLCYVGLTGQKRKMSNNNNDYSMLIKPIKFALLASRMDECVTVLIEYPRKTSQSVVIFDKYRRQTLTVALFNLYYVFYIVRVKHVQWCVASLITVHIDLPLDGVCIRSQKATFVCMIGCETRRECSGSQLATAGSARNTLRKVSFFYFTVFATLNWILHEYCQAHRRCHSDQICPTA